MLKSLVSKLGMKVVGAIVLLIILAGIVAVLILGNSGNDLKLVNMNSKYGFVNKDKKIIIPIIFSEGYDFKEGLARVKGKDGWNYYDGKGKTKITITPEKGDIAYDFKEGLAKLKKQGKYGYMNNTGYRVIKARYDEAGDFSEGLAFVKFEGKYGYIDQKGIKTITPKFAEAKSFSEGLAPAKSKDLKKWGLIDKTGKFIVKPKYDNIEEVTHGKAVVVTGGLYGVIDKKGEEVVEPRYESMQIDKNSGIMIYGQTGANGKEYGFLNSKGEETGKAKYWSISGFIGDKALVQLVDGTYQLINKNEDRIATIGDINNGELGINSKGFTVNNGEKYIDQSGKVIWNSQEETNLSYAGKRLTNEEAVKKVSNFTGIGEEALTVTVDSETGFYKVSKIEVEEEVKAEPLKEESSEVSEVVVVGDDSESSSVEIPVSEEPVEKVEKTEKKENVWYVSSNSGKIFDSNMKPATKKSKNKKEL